jgi:hypothetical protein
VTIRRAPCTPCCGASSATGASAPA